MLSLLLSVPDVKKKKQKQVHVETKHMITSVSELSACGETCSKTTSPNVDKNMLLSHNNKEAIFVQHVCRERYE